MGHTYREMFKVMTACLSLCLVWLTPTSWAVEQDFSKAKKVAQKRIYLLNEIAHIEINTIIQTIEKARTEALENDHGLEINLYIQSSGGSINYALSLFNYLKSLHHDTTIKTYNLSSVSSAANIIFCAGEERYAFPYSRFLFHEPRLTLNTRDREQEYDVLLQDFRAASTLMKSVLKECSDFSQAQIEQYHTNGDVLTAEFALKHGYVTQIDGTSRIQGIQYPPAVIFNPGNKAW